MTLVDAVSDALRLTDRHTQTSAVHDVVRNALREVAPDVEVRSTDYFTHTFVPDLILGWGPSNERQQRHVHLRFVVTDPSLANEVNFLASTEPVFLGLLDDSAISSPYAELEPAFSDSGTLVTQAAAVDALEEGRERDTRTVAATQEIVRGGRGRLDHDRAAGLVGAYHASLLAIERLDGDESVAGERTQVALANFRTALHPRQFSTVERDLRSRWISQGGDPFSFPGERVWDPVTLSRDELGQVLNALLDSDRPVPAEVWTRNAWFLSAEALAETLGNDRRGGALNLLAAALLPSWTAQWVWAEDLGFPLFSTYDWLITDRTLAVEIGDVRLSFRDDGRRFKDKKPTDEQLRTVSGMEDVLRDPNVQAAIMHTRSEDITYAYRAAGDQLLYDRILQVIEPSQREELRVSEVRTLVPGQNDLANIDLARRVIDLDKRPTPISVLIRLAMNYFHHAGYDHAEVENFLRTGMRRGAE